MAYQAVSLFLLTPLQALSVGISTWTFEESVLIPQRSPHTCGTIAYLTAQALLGLQMSHPPFFCTSSSCSVGPWMDIVGFGPNAVATQLAALLVTKGVPCQQAPDRAEAAIEKLGVTATQAALQNHNPCCQATGIQTGM
jgi:hypothetical protein